jgi:hypothetical protein
MAGIRAGIVSQIQGFLLVGGEHLNTHIGLNEHGLALADQPSRDAGANRREALASVAIHFNGLHDCGAVLAKPSLWVPL